MAKKTNRILAASLLLALGTLSPLTVQAATEIDRQGVEKPGYEPLKRARDAWEEGKWIGLDLSSSYDIPRYDAPTGTTIKHQANVMADFRLSILRNRVFQWTYKRTGETAEDTANAQKNAAKVMKLEANINRLWSSVPVQFAYTQQIYNTFVTTGSSSDVWLISGNNTTATSGSVSPTDTGITTTTSGQKLGLKTARQRFDAVWVSPQDDGAELYYGVFLDKLKKPWEDPTSTWTNGSGQRVTVVYGDALFDTKGITVGWRPVLKNGWNISNASFDFGKSKINLTDNLSLSKRLGNEGYEVWKWGLGGELLYQASRWGVNAYAALYARIDSYKVNEKGDSNSSGSGSSSEAISISNDRVIGARIGLNF